MRNYKLSMPQTLSNPSYKICKINLLNMFTFYINLHMIYAYILWQLALCYAIYLCEATTHCALELDVKGRNFTT